MKKQHLLLITLGVVALLGMPRAWAGTGTASAMRVATVDFQKAINETEEGKQAEKSLNTALAEKKKKFDIMKGELEALRKDFEQQRLVLTGKPLDDKKEALQKKLMEVEQTGMGYEQELSQKKADTLKKIVTGLQEVVQDIGSKEKFDFIFEKSQGGVLYSSGAEDITSLVIKTYNARPKK